MMSGTVPVDVPGSSLNLPFFDYVSILYGKLLLCPFMSQGQTTTVHLLAK